MTDPVAALGIANQVRQSATNGVRASRRSASNVVLIVTTAPRTQGGYSVELQVRNRSEGGLADVRLHVRVTDGELHHRGEVFNEVLYRPRVAIAAGDVWEGRIPHLLKLPPRAWDIDDADTTESITTTLWWIDDQRKRWSRTDGDLAKRCRSERAVPSPQSIAAAQSK